MSKGDQGLSADEPPGAGLEHPALDVWHAMERFVQRSERELAARLRDHDLNLGQLDLLRTLSAAEGMSQQELARRLGHSKANVSQLLDRMVSAGLVQRVPGGRAYGIYLTDVGRALLATVAPTEEHVITQRFSRLSVDEQQALVRLLAKLGAVSD